jgi:hypothetical protein
MEYSKNHQIFYQEKKKKKKTSFGDFSPQEKGLPPMELCLASVFGEKLNTKYPT